MATAAFCAAPALAQNARPYNNGPVWSVSNIQTKNGHFNDYMHYVDTAWRALQEDSKKRGWVVDYKVLTAIDPRDNEPDIYLMVEYKNMAAMDVSLDALDEQTKALEGSVGASDRGFADRDKIRTLRGTVLARELILK
ncbi:MAG TPA: hypothetical protein VII49_02475 [Rhizomicrobium sp.]